MIFILFYSGGPLFQRLVFSLIRSSSLLGWHHRLGPREADSEMYCTSTFIRERSWDPPHGTEGKEAGLGRGRSRLVVGPVGPRLVHRELRTQE